MKDKEYITIVTFDGVCNPRLKSILEPVVRCHECKHSTSLNDYCNLFGDPENGWYARIEPYGYCAWGEEEA